MTLTELASHLVNGEISSAEIVKEYAERRDTVGAYITRCDDVLRQAACADHTRFEGEAHLLCGIPLAVKDNICTKGVRTTSGSRMLENFVPPYDASAWQNLKQKGCILLGKTNMDEFGMGSSTENSAFHPTSNPLDASRVPGGSSGGSAACVAAHLAPAALGTDTGGSIRQPAAFCGLVGMKPTYGTVSRSGLIAFASSLDCIGPMTRTVEDNAMLMDILRGHDPLDATTVNRDYSSLRAELQCGVKQLRVGLPAEMLGTCVSSDVKDAVLRAAKVLEGLGASVEEVHLPHVEQTLPAYYVLSSAEASSNLARYDGVRYGYRAQNNEDLEELYIRSRSEGFGDEVKRRILLGTYALSAGYYDAYYAKAQKIRELIKADFARSFQTCDLLLAPVTPAAAWHLGEKKTPMEMYRSDIFTVPASMAGIPAMSVPFGTDHEGMPLAVQLMGAHFAESILYRAAYALEVTNHG